MSKKTFSTEHHVMYYDTDCGGVVHNLAYLRWVEECRTRMGIAFGLNHLELVKEQLFTVVVRHEVDYHFPATINDMIHCEGFIESIEKSSLWFQFVISRVSDGKKLVSVRQRLALVRMPSGRPCRIPAEWHELVNE